jgi:NAD+ kinase
MVVSLFFPAEGDHIKVTASKYPFPTVCADRSSTDWFHSISRTLKWNERERQKSFVVVEESNVAATAPKQAHLPSDFEGDLENDDEEDEVSDEEEDKYDIDVIEDSPPAVVQVQTSSLLQSHEAQLGSAKVAEDARAVAAARVLAKGSPVLTHGRPGGLHSGIETPDRFLGTYPHPPSARHVAFASDGDSSKESSGESAALHAPRAVHHHHHHHRSDPGEREGLRTPTAGEIRRGASRGRTRSRSRETRQMFPPPRAFAVRGQDESESESNASEDELQ